MDPAGFGAPAHIKALVLPVGSLTVLQFHEHYERLQQGSQIALSGVSLPSSTPGSTNYGPDSSNHLSVPSAQSSGTLAPSSGRSAARTFDPRAARSAVQRFSFETAVPPPAHRALEDLEVWRRQLVVVGVAQHGTPHDVLAASLKELRATYSGAVYHAVLIFSNGDVSEAAGESDEAEGVFYVSSVMTALQALSAQFFERLEWFWAARQLSSFQSPVPLSETTNTSSGSALGHAHTRSGVAVGRTGSISMSTTERAKSRQDGRTRRVLGNLYLLAGLVDNALTELGMAASALQQTGDHLWLGATLSDIALCIVMQRLAGQTPRIPAAAISLAWAAAAKTLKKKKTPSSSAAATATVTSAGTATGPGGAAASGAGGAGGAGSSHGSVAAGAGASAGHGVNHGAAAGDERAITSPRTSLGLARAASLKKSKPFTESTPVEEILDFIVAAALDEFALGQGAEIVPYTVYYETVVRYANLVVCLRHGWTMAALAEAVKGEAAAAVGESSSDHSEATATSTKSTSTKSTVATSTSAAGAGGTAVAVERWIARVYGLNLGQLEPDVQALILGGVARVYAKAGMRRKWAFTCTQIVGLLAAARATIGADIGQLSDVLRVYARWPRLEAQMLRKLVPLGQRLQSATLQTDAASQLLALACRGTVNMVDKEQLTLYHLIRSYSGLVQAAFWDKGLVEMTSIKAQRLQRASKRNSVANALGGGSINGGMANNTGGAIIYNPFEAETKETGGSVEAGSPTTGKVWLRNPLAIDIQVFELALVDADGRRVSETAENVTIPAHSSQFKIEVMIVPPAGRAELVVSACVVQVSGCAARTFAVPEIRIPVIPARPVLALQELSLSKGWAMLLEGERRRFAVVLWNATAIGNRIVHFGFNDSTVDALRGAAARADASRAELHENEFLLHHRRAIDYVGTQADETQDAETASDDGDADNEASNVSAMSDNASDDSDASDGSSGSRAPLIGDIAGHTSRKYLFDLTGKRGVSSAAVLVDYGVSEASLRRLKIPLQVTVYSSVSVERASVLPGRKKNTVLLVADLRNSWREPLNCRVWAEGERRGKGGSAGSASRGSSAGGDNGKGRDEECSTEDVRIESGTTKRFLLELPWTAPSGAAVRRPIPSLAAKQYTVDTRTTPEQLLTFWLREALLSRLRGEWHNGHGRRGYIELRTIQLSRRMVEVLRKRTVEVAGHVAPAPRVDVPARFVVTVTNHGSEAVGGVLRLIANKTAQSYMLVLGQMQQWISVARGEERTVEFEVLFLSGGPYELSSVLDPVDGQGEAVFQAQKTKVHI